MVAQIDVIGLGPGPAKYLTLETSELLQSGIPIYLRTAIHPTIEELRSWNCRFTSFDALYEQAQDFEDLYQKIIDQLFSEAKAKQKIIYAVPGHPLVAETTVHQLIQQGPQQGVEIKVHTAVSCLDVLFETLTLDPTDNLKILDGLQLDRHLLDHRLPLIITQVYSPLIANEVKLTLLERLPPEYQITVVQAAGMEQVRIETLPLEKLDRLDWIDHLTTVYIPPTQDHNAFPALERLRSVVAHLREPETGCPWDLKQTPQSLRKYILEEAYEVIEAIEQNDPVLICEELGDLLLQVYLQAQIAQDMDIFNLDEVADGISEKLIYRHPHVFENNSELTPEEVKIQWEILKAQEKSPEESILSNLPSALPALSYAEKIQHKVAQVGFDWPDLSGVFDKLKEEYQELLEASQTQDKSAIAHELGDLIFVLANLARWYKLDAEDCLRQTNLRFKRRFQYMESKIESELNPVISLETWEKYWQDAKENVG